MSGITISLIIAVIVLLVICFRLLLNNIDRDKEIKYIANKINSIYSNSTSERVLLRTHNKDMKELLINLNKILEKNQKNDAFKYFS